MPALWPVTLPQSPSPEGFSEKLPNTLVRTQMDAGPAKVRRRSTVDIRMFIMTFLLDPEQVEIFDAFFLTDLAYGSLTFTFTHPRKLTSMTLRLTSPPEITAIGGLVYQLRMECEQVP